MATKAPAKAKTGRAKTTKRKASSSKIIPHGRSGWKHLVIVESPAKARTIGQIMGKEYLVVASQGHVRDLPKSKIGVDIEQNFQPSYVVIRNKSAIIKDLKQAGNKAVDIFLATDPDREGEAISWHLQSEAGWDQLPEPPKRIVFHEITKEAINEAFLHPKNINMGLVNAQQARRILDRLVGYQISPLLWRRVQRGLSAGRVQSVSLRIVVDREREIESFVPKESWTLEAQLYKETDQKGEFNIFKSVMHSIAEQKTRPKIADETSARIYENELRDATYTVATVNRREVSQRPTAPFITSTMQQEANRKLHYTARKTMVVAQQLYEGLAVNDEGPAGLITYMRTDSTKIAGSALVETRQYIKEKFGMEFLPEKARVHQTRSKIAQEAHEAIRPTSIWREPKSLKPYLTPDQLSLYKLIWERMLASQMSDARSDATTVDIKATCKGSSSVYIFRATGSVLKFPGFRTLYSEGRDDEKADVGRTELPYMTSGDPLRCSKLDTVQHFTQPPPRYTEATLIKALEEKGIGRPSTYAPTVSTLLDRQYVVKERNHLTPTKLGTIVTDLLKQFFTQIMDLDFTAKLEEELDDVSRGERDWIPMLHEFYQPFAKALVDADALMPRIKLEEKTDEICEACARPMVIKTGRFGRFIACTGFPECKTTKPLLKTINVSCPKCNSDLVERRSRGKRRSFYGCSKYPVCDFISLQRPVDTPCPECEGLMVEESRDQVACTVCVWKGPVQKLALALASSDD
jgi:DNA topoisomerase-1